MEKVYPIQKPIINYSDTLFVYKFHEGEIRYPSIVCTSPAGSVKEQSSGLYAQKLAEQGFVPLTHPTKQRAAAILGMRKIPTIELKTFALP